MLRQGRRPKVRYDVWLKTFGRPEFALLSSPTSPISPIDQWFQTRFFSMIPVTEGAAESEATCGVEKKSAQALGCRLQHPQFSYNMI